MDTSQAADSGEFICMLHHVDVDHDGDGMECDGIDQLVKVLRLDDFVQQP